MWRYYFSPRAPQQEELQPFISGQAFMDNRSLHDSIGADSEEAILVGVAAGVHPFVLPGDEVRAAFDMNDSDRAFGQDQFEAG